MIFSWTSEEGLVELDGKPIPPEFLKKYGRVKFYSWIWRRKYSDGVVCSHCGDLTTVLYGRNPTKLPGEQTHKPELSSPTDLSQYGVVVFGSSCLMDSVGVCLSCVPGDEIADNPDWYMD